VVSDNNKIDHVLKSSTTFRLTVISKTRYNKGAYLKETLLQNLHGLCHLPLQPQEPTAPLEISSVLCSPKH
jgi:hypothetical protein